MTGSTASRVLLIVTLVVAGEMVFALPFNTARFFRPTLLEVFGFTNTELGDVFAAYGIVAMLSYFPGGALADRFPARWLLTASLAATAAGGIVMAAIPGGTSMAVLYAYWGFTSTFLFWGALIRATRDWGGHAEQGRAFGLLEGGRGLVAASLAALLSVVFALAMPEDPDLASAAERRAAFRQVILWYTAATAATAVLAWFAVPVPANRAQLTVRPVAGMGIVLRRPVVWAQAGVVVCAYCAFKGLDNYGLYGRDVLGFDEVEANWLATWGAFLRPVAAIAAGVAADRYSATRTCGVLFGVLAAACLPLAFMAPGPHGVLPLVLTLLVTFALVYALRGVYFALLEENRTPVRYTGATVGMVSLVGFTPEIFFAPIAGRILDADPGLPGHQNYFLFLAAIALAGVAVTAVLAWLNRRRGHPPWPTP
ncbi:MAG TPA: MFS transporter [Woeseiaceae bacterium]|nr:MFS transporter [Woeseiaceae bacterium]